MGLLEDLHRHREALKELKAEFAKFKVYDGTLKETAVELQRASEAVVACKTIPQDGSEALVAQLRNATRALKCLEPGHQQLLEAFNAVTGPSKPRVAAIDLGQTAKGKPKRGHTDFSAFTRARWEAERLKGASMLAQDDASGVTGIKVWVGEMPKPVTEEKPASQVYGRQIVSNTMEKIRRVYVEIAVTGERDRSGFIRGANVAKFSSIAAVRSDCPCASKGGLLGWVQRGKLDKKVEEVVFSTPQGTCSPPFRSGASGTFHVFLCEERKG